MSLARLLNQPLTIVKIGGSTTDAYGNQSATVYGTPTSTVGYLEQKTTVEYLDDRDVTTTSWEVYLPADSNIVATDRIIFNGVTYEFDGMPWSVYNPRTKQVSHIQAMVKVVQ